MENGSTEQIGVLIDLRWGAEVRSHMVFCQSALKKDTWSCKLVAKRLNVCSLSLFYDTQQACIAGSDTKHKISDT